MMGHTKLPRSMRVIGWIARQCGRITGFALCVFLGEKRARIALRTAGKEKTSD